MKNSLRKQISLILCLAMLLTPLCAYGGVVESEASIGSEYSVRADMYDSALLTALEKALGEKGISFQYVDKSWHDDVNGKMVIEYTAGFRPEDIAAVTELTLNNSYIFDIRGLEVFTSLKSLNISNNSVSSLAPLSAMTSLESLDAYGNAVSRLSELDNLSEMSGLKHLSLAKNKLSDNGLAAGSGITAYLTALKPEGAETLTLSGLEELDLSHNFLKYSYGLYKLSGLKSLNLYDNAIHDLSGLKGDAASEVLSSLSYLNLGENWENSSSHASFSGLSALGSLSALEWFDFSKNYEPNIITAINELSGLKYLYLDNNKLTSAEGLENKTLLKELVLCNNTIPYITPLLGLSELETLYIGNAGLAEKDKNTGLSGLSGCIITDSETQGKSLVWPKLKTLDISRNWKIWSMEERIALYELFVNGSLNLYYTYNNVQPTTGLPHTDEESGKKYVCFEDFGARCDGVYDDAYAMINAYRFAEANPGTEVRGTAGKTYHIFGYYSGEIGANASTDFCGANIIIHDEDIEQKSARMSRVFRISNTTNIFNSAKNDYVTIDSPSWTIGKATKAFDLEADEYADLAAAIAELKGKLPETERFFCIAENSGKSMFMRSGSLNANSGEAAVDHFVIDENGTLEDDIQWDFDKLTSFKLLPIKKDGIFMKNGHFTTYGIKSLSETPYGRSGGGYKSIYFYRQIYFTGCTNLELSNLTHSQTPDEMCGSYNGFFAFYQCADVDMHDCEIYTRKFTQEGRSAYGLRVDRSVNLYFHNILPNTEEQRTDSHRWGVEGTTYTKDVVYDNYRLNRIDAHQGVYNLTIRNSEIGYISVFGQGNMKISNTTFWNYAPLRLRSDYGAAWNGNIEMIDCTVKYFHTAVPTLCYIGLDYDKDGNPWYYGYERRFPNIYIENLTIDNEYNLSDRTEFLMINNWASMQADKMPETYWPDYYILNGCRFINNEHLSKNPTIKIKASNTGKTQNTDFVISETFLDFSELPAGYVSKAEIMRDLFEGKSCLTAAPVSFKWKENASAGNSIRVFKDGEDISTTYSTEGGEIDAAISESGHYRILLTSEQTIGSGQNAYSLSGERSLEFTISELALSDGNGGAWTPGRIPEGTVYIDASGYGDELSEGESATLYLACYDANGRLIAYSLKGLSGKGEEAQGEEAQAEPSVSRFELRNSEGEIKSIKLIYASGSDVPRLKAIEL